MPSFQERLEQALQLRDMTPAQLSKATSIGEGAISQYRKGAYKASQKSLEKISRALRVSIPWLMGISDEMTPAAFEEAAQLPSNLIPMGQMKKIPLIGSIACGTPILAQENIRDYIDLPQNIRADFALECKGDSMINAGIRDGDIVYIRKQPQVENGQIAAVLVDDGNEATLKRFYRTGDTVTLTPENPAYAPKVFTRETINELRIAGLAIAFLHPLV